MVITPQARESLARMAAARLEALRRTPNNTTTAQDIVADAIDRAFEVARMGRVQPAGPTVVAATLAMRAGITKGTASARLLRLAERGIIDRVERGAYAVTPGRERDLARCGSAVADVFGVSDGP